jgi:hypothetical protein
MAAPAIIASSIIASAVIAPAIIAPAATQRQQSFFQPVSQWLYPAAVHLHFLPAEDTGLPKTHDGRDI